MAIELTRGGNAVQPVMTQSLRAVAFDLDSTLCRYVLTVREVLQRALQRTGLGTDVLGPLDELVDAYEAAWWTVEQHLRLPTDELRRRAWSAVLKERGFDDEPTTERLADSYTAIRQETGLELFPGVASFLADLRPQYRLGILTNGPSDMQWDKVRTLGLAVAVDAIVVAGDSGVFKPDRRSFQALLDRLDVAPDVSLFVGNSYEHDIVGAHAAGMRTVWVTGDGVGDRTPPDHVIQRVTDLRKVLL